MAGQEHGDPLGHAGADQVAGGGAAAVVEEAGRHASRLTGGAPRRAPAADGDAVKAKQGFREFQAARRTIQGYEAMHMIRKGQARWVSGSDVRRQIQFINNLFGVAV